MSEDEGQESGCDTVEGSPTSDASASPRGDDAYGYLDNGNLPSLPAMVAPPPTPAAQGQSVRSVRTMVVPPMTNNNHQGTEELAQRAGQWDSYSHPLVSLVFHLNNYWSVTPADAPGTL